MALAECPVHQAGRQALKDDNPLPLMAKIGPRDATPECAGCPFCQKVLEVNRIFRTTGGRPDQAWEELKQFPPDDE
jgi:hypothetical protein